MRLLFTRTGLILLVFLVWCIPVHAGITCVQGPGVGNCTNTTAIQTDGASASPTLTVTNPTEHNLGYIFAAQGTAARTISSISGDCNVTWLRGPAATSNTNSSGELWYCLDLHAGGTTITLNWSGTCATNGCDHAFVELHTDKSGSWALNSGATPTASNTGSTSPGTMATLTVSTNNSIYVLGFKNSLSAATACSLSYCPQAGNFGGTSTRVAVGWLLNQTSYSAPTVTSGANPWVAGMMAFQEPSSLSTIPWYELPTAGPSWAILLLVGLGIGSIYGATHGGISENGPVFDIERVAGNHTGTRQLLAGFQVIDMVPDAQGIYEKVSVPSQARPKPIA